MARFGRSWTGRLALVTAGALGILSSVPAVSAAPREAGLRGVPTSYIVVLKPGVAPKGVSLEHARQWGARITHVYRYALSGYSARMTAPALRLVRLDQRVAYVVPDGVMHIDATTQNDPPWGLDRIDQRSLPLSSTYTYTKRGAGVTAYMLDSGIRITHHDFGGRASHGYDAVDGSLPANDCDGHGTHTAGIVGGATYGVAKAVSLVAVRVVHCDGDAQTSEVIAGVDWVTGDHISGPAVANMSLGGSPNTALDDAVRNSIADGIVYSFSAGNGNSFGIGINACNQSPARVTEGMTISATNRRDSKPVWANYGNCVDLFAPGVGVRSASNGSDTATASLEGTSMAVAHNTGVAALYLQTHQNATPAQVEGAIVGMSTKDIIKNSWTAAHNDLLFTSP